GLLYGQGDVERTVVISMRGGYDSDCNPSSAAGVLGAMTGFSKLPARYTQELKFEPKFSYTAYNVPALLDVCERLARQVVAQQGGRVEKGAQGKEWFVIPRVAAKPGPYTPTWLAGPIAGSRFTDEEYAKIRFKPHPGDVGGNDPTARVQGALDALLPGWKTSANGKDMEPGYRAEYLGRQHVVMTHPLDKDTGVTLSKRITVPTDAASKLAVMLANHGPGDFTFVARADGKEILRQRVGGAKAAWQAVTVDLAPFAGKAVTVELVNQPDGWSWEAAYWGGVEVK
ncbi:MAG TPA: ADP-ribosylglycohydrolase family protein, partial [Kiritimatiellia bacterium]|nr:ADP-ribosylglycohydrolase family protein [Kiritimatiellia bacterium]